MTSSDPFAPTIASYDLIADDYARRNAVAPDDTVRRQETFATMAGEGGVVADVGCGPGRDAAWFAARGLRVVGFDASTSMALRARAVGVTVARADLRRLPVRDGALDGIWSSASLLHVPRPDVPATLREWVRCLRPHGALGLSTSLGDVDGWEVVPYEPSTQPEETAADLKRWFVHHDRDDLLGMLASAGFSVTEVSEFVGARRWLQVLAVT